MARRRARTLSDFDVIAYNRSNGEVIIAECKGWGSPESYLNFSTDKRLNKLKSIAEKIVNCWKNFVNSRFNKYGFGKDELKKVIIVIPGYISSTNKHTTISGVPVEIKPVHEVILDIIKIVKNDMYVRRRRYWNPALEMIRWIIRALNSGALREDELVTALRK